MAEQDGQHYSRSLKLSKLNMDVQGRKLHFWFDTETWLAIEEEF